MASNVLPADTTSGAFDKLFVSNFSCSLHHMCECICLMTDMSRTNCGRIVTFSHHFNVNFKTLICHVYSCLGPILTHNSIGVLAVHVLILYFDVKGR